MTLMIWSYLSSAVILIGGTLNAIVHKAGTTEITDTGGQDNC